MDLIHYTGLGLGLTLSVDCRFKLYERYFYHNYVCHDYGRKNISILKYLFMNSGTLSCLYLKSIYKE